MDTTFLCHLHWNSHDNQIWSSQHVNPSYNSRDLLCLKSLEFYLKPLKATVPVAVLQCKCKHLFLIPVTVFPTHFPYRNSEKRHYETNTVAFNGLR